MRFLTLFLLAAGLLHANTRAPAEPITKKERDQRHSDRAILAKPRAQHRGTVDSAEVRERIRVREKFARLGELRVIELEGGEPVDRAIARLMATGRYEFVEPDHVMLPHATPNDASFVTQWSL